ncbi:MAG: hypothetical protein ACOC04_05380 [Halothece sp.]
MSLSKLAVTSGLVFLPLAATAWIGLQAKTHLQAQAPNLPPVHVDEPVEETWNQRFSFDSSLERLGQIEGALDSFRTLTETIRTTVGEERISFVGNTSAEVQTLGFPNWVNSVEGTLRKQDYQIQKLEYELAKEQFEDGEISQAELDEKAASYQEAKADFEAFWQQFNIAD